MEREVVKAIDAVDAVDARFISVTICPVDAADMRELSKLQALLFIDPPRLARRITAHQFMARTTKTAEDKALPSVKRKRARLVL